MDLPVELVGLLKHAGIDGKKLTWDLQVNSSGLPIKLRIVWVDRSLTCVNVVGLWRACSSLCISVCVLSSVMGILSSVCVSAQVLMHVVIIIHLGYKMMSLELCVI
jgi:hypothetical protein